MNENKKLKAKVDPINEKLSELNKEKEDLSVLYQQSQTELSKLRGEFEFLKESSSEYLKLKAEHEMTQSKLDSVEKRSQELEIENIKIKDSQRNIWFATGALVLLFGIILGSILGRQSRQKGSSYY